MKQSPILFQPDMVRALLDGRKTQTRRIMKPQPNRIPNLVTVKDKLSVMYRKNKGNMVTPCPYGKKGDLIYVKETHYRFGKWIKNGITKTGKQKWKFEALSDVLYYEDDKPTNIKPNKFRSPAFYKRNSLFMPHELSRLTLKIIDVRVERVQEITNDDAKAEGLEHAAPHRHGAEGLEFDELPGKPIKDPYADKHNTGINDCWICMYRQLWMTINGIKSWNDNPWVWVLEFEVVKQNIDDYLKESA